MSLVHKHCVYLHVVKVLYVVGSPVKLLLCLGCCVLSCLCSTFLVLLPFLVRHFGKLCLQAVKFTLGVPCNHALRVYLLYLFKHVFFLLNPVVDELHLPLFTVGNTLKHTLGYNNHIPIIVLDFCVEPLTTFLIALIVGNGQHLGIRIKLFCGSDKLPDGCILHNYHRFSRQSQPAHFHCSGYQSKSFTRTNLVGKHYRPPRCAYGGFRLVGEQGYLC